MAAKVAAREAPRTAVKVLARGVEAAARLAKALAAVAETHHNVSGL